MDIRNRVVKNKIKNKKNKKENFIKCDIEMKWCRQDKNKKISKIKKKIEVMENKKRSSKDKNIVK